MINRALHIISHIQWNSLTKWNVKNLSIIINFVICNWDHRSFMIVEYKILKELCICMIKTKWPRPRKITANPIMVELSYTHHFYWPSMGGVMKSQVLEKSMLMDDTQQTNHRRQRTPTHSNMSPSHSGDLNLGLKNRSRTPYALKFIRP